MLLNLESLGHRGTNLSADVQPQLESTTRAVTALVVRRRIMNGRRDEVSNVSDYSKVSGVSLESIYRELLQYIQHNLPTERQRHEAHAILQSLPVELLTQLEIPLVAFQESDVYDIHCARCTGARHFRNPRSRND